MKQMENEMNVSVPLEVIKASEIEPKEVKWLWYPYIPFGKVTLLQGDPGDGKSKLMLSIAALLSKGEPLPFTDTDETEPMTIIYQTTEDDADDTVVPRFNAAGGNGENLIFIKEDVKSLSFGDNRIAEAIEKYHAKLLILDPMSSYIGEDCSMNNANETRAEFNHLIAVAKDTGCAIVIIAHMNKMKDTNPLYRTNGSIDIAGAVRSIIAITRTPNKEAPSERYMVQVKSNLAPTGSAILFEVAEKGVNFISEMEMTAEQAFQSLAPKMGRPNEKEVKATEMILEMLKDGEMLTSECEEKLEAAGFKKSTIKKAKMKAGALSKKVGFQWYWYLPVGDNPKRIKVDCLLMGQSIFVREVSKEVKGNTLDHDIFADEDVLDAPYFHLVFTVPDILNPVIYSNQKLLYDTLYHATSTTIQELTSDPKHLGASVGYICILHTWGSEMNFHPHIHTILLGGGLTPKNEWKDNGTEFFLPIWAISKVFRGKYMDELKNLWNTDQLEFHGTAEKYRNHYAFKELIDSCYDAEWVPYCKKTFNGAQSVIDYLGKYTHRIAISNHRIIHMDDENVTFSVKDYRKEGQWKELTLSGIEFIRRFLMHVPPRRFVRIRHYGLLCSRSKHKKLTLCRNLLGCKKYLSRLRAKEMPEILKQLYGINICVCKSCGGHLGKPQLRIPQRC